MKNIKNDVLKLEKSELIRIIETVNEFSINLTDDEFAYKISNNKNKFKLFKDKTGLDAKYYYDNYDYDLADELSRIKLSEKTGVPIEVLLEQELQLQKILQSHVDDIKIDMSFQKQIQNLNKKQL
jgi:hypothetical protein